MRSLLFRGRRLCDAFAAACLRRGVPALLAATVFVLFATTFPAAGAALTPSMSPVRVFPPAFPVADGEEGGDSAGDAAPEEKKPDGAVHRNLRLFNEMVDIIGESFYDKKNYHGVDLDAFRTRWGERIDAKANLDGLHTLMRESLKEFRASHLTVMRGGIYARYFGSEFTDNKTWRFDIELAVIDGRVFVEHTLNADESGTQPRRGDEIVAIEGVEPLKSEHLVDGGSDPIFEPHYTLLPPASNTLALRIRRAADAEPQEVVLKAARTNFIEAMRSSAKVIERDGRYYGYFRIYHFLNGALLDMLRDAITDAFAGTDGLIIDLRGRGGSPGLLFSTLSLLGLHDDRWKQFAPGLTAPTADAPGVYRGPVVGLIDGSSRSAKEVWAYWFQCLKRGRLVGQATAGAVLGANFRELSDGSYFMVPVWNPKELYIDSDFTLEGNPVQPDVVVDLPLMFQQGRDPLIEAGMREMDSRMDPDKPSLYRRKQEELHPQTAPADEADF